MSKISVKRRKFEIRKKQKRRIQLAKLRASLVKAKTSKQKQEVLAKLVKIAPHLSEKELSSR